jgi:hypothetical protein
MRRIVLFCKDGLVNVMSLMKIQIYFSDHVTLTFVDVRSFVEVSIR